ncbi:MAG: hypothetical protein NPIRA05_10230 [Nitrospirales bacterium]|nr:MAG: hypothetical protein NPIRA05_10230 [Nitrospirales bacterium]
MRKTGWTLFMFVLVGGLFGGLLGEIFRVATPPGTIQNVFARALSPGLDPPVTIDLVLIKFTFGFLLKMNFFTFVGAVLGFYLYKNL